MAVMRQIIDENYAIYEGDCIEIMGGFPNDSIHLSIYSPPFANDRGGLYQYSNDDRDLSNSRDFEEFLDHYDFVLAEMFRITMPGRRNLVHCMDVPTGNSGKDSLIDFPGELIDRHCMCRKQDCDDTARCVERAS